MFREGARLIGGMGFRKGVRVAETTLRKIKGYGVPRGGRRKETEKGTGNECPGGDERGGWIES